MHRPAHAAEGRRLLGRRDRCRMLAVRQPVQLLQKRDRVEVLAAAVLVGNPLAFLARVVEVQHRRHGVHAQAVDVILLEPEQRVRQQEVADLVPAVVEDQRAPVLVLALPRIGVLEERRAVEPGEAVLVLRKMAGHPVENHAEAGLVAGVDEQLEVLGRAEAAGRREESEHLVAPRSRERMLHHRQQLDVREAHLLHVRHEPVRQLACTSETDCPPRERAPTIRDAPRRSPSADRSQPPCSRRLAIHASSCHCVAGDVADDRRRLRRHLEGDAERIALLQQRRRPSCGFRTCSARRRAGPA